MPSKKIFFCIVFLMSIFFCSESTGQKIPDTAAIKSRYTSDNKNILSLDTSAKKYNPKVATFRSAVLPGWGQAYNKKYWKIPIVYAALGITAYIFFDNLKTYKLLRQAVIYRLDTIPANDALIDEQFINLSTESIRGYRNTFRQYVDYSVIFFLLFWGLNVVDATVDAHLKSFDVGDDISLKIKPGYNLNANTAGISLVFTFKDKRAKVLPSLR